jgi:hypothetical protein
MEVLVCQLQHEQPRHDPPQRVTSAYVCDDACDHQAVERPGSSHIPADARVQKPQAAVDRDSDDEDDDCPLKWSPFTRKQSPYEDESQGVE